MAAYLYSLATTITIVLYIHGSLHIQAYIKIFFPHNAHTRVVFSCVIKRHFTYNLIRKAIFRLQIKHYLLFTLILNQAHAGYGLCLIIHINFIGTLVRYRITSNSKSVTKILSHNKLRCYFDNKSNMKRFAYFNRQHLITCVFANLTQHSFYRKSHKFIIYKTNLKNNCPSHPFVQEIKSILCSGTVWKIPLVLTRKEVFSFNT